MSDTTVWHRAADIGELADGQLKVFGADRLTIVLARVGDKYGALRDQCPHAGGPLSQGCIENGFVVCPWHGREYDPFTGTCDGYQATQAYQVEVRDDGIFVAT